MPGFELIGPEERKAVDEVLQTGILGRYGFTELRGSQYKAQQLEQELCAHFGSRHAQLVSSGTAALVTALAALNIGAGHEVIIPVFGDVSVFEAVVSVGAIPVFSEINETLTLDTEAVRNRITNRTKAVILVHTAGAMAAAAPLKELCTAHHIFLIEDASQAIGASAEGRWAGTTGDAGVISFDSNNTITCGEGGVILTDNDNLYKLCNEYSDHGHDHLGAQRTEDQHRYLGAGYRISELHAAVGIAQLRKLPAILEIQRKACALLKAELEKVSGLRFLQEGNRETANGAYLTVSVHTEAIAAEAVSAFREAGIPARYWYQDRWHYIRHWEHIRNGSWMNRVYNDQKKNILHHSNLVFPASDAIMSRCISFPISLKHSETEWLERSSAIAGIFRQVIAQHNHNH